MEDTTLNKEKLEKEKEELVSSIAINYSEVLECIDVFINNFNFNPKDYIEFNENKYIDGTFLKITKGLFINRRENYTLVADLYSIFNLAKQQKALYDIEHNIELCDKILKLKLKDYTEILRAYATQIHKALILEGKGFSFGDNLGWICINRCVLRNPKPIIDYSATKKREEELLVSGKRIYNKDEAEWCKRNGIEYKAEDKRVFKTNEYCYEIPLIGCKLPNGNKLKLEIADYRHTSMRNKTNDELIQMCNSDTNKICELPLDLKTKLTLCDKADKILFTKFIRNEAQQSITTPKTLRKS